MKYFILLLVIASYLIASKASANDPLIDDLILRWDTPTAYENGAALEPQDIEGYNIYYTLDGIDQPDINVPSGTNSYVLEDAAFGTYEFTISTIAKGMEGKPSDIYEKIYHLPKAPENIQIIKRSCALDGACTEEILLEVVQ